MRRISLTTEKLSDGHWCYCLRYPDGTAVKGGPYADRARAFVSGVTDADAQGYRKIELDDPDIRVKP